MSPLLAAVGGGAAAARLLPPLNPHNILGPEVAAAVPEAAGPGSPRVDEPQQNGHGEDEAADGDPDDGAHGDGIGESEPNGGAQLTAVVLRHEVVGAVVAGGHTADSQLGDVAILPVSQQKNDYFLFILYQNLLSIFIRSICTLRMRISL